MSLSHVPSVAATDTPISLAEAKLHMHVDTSNEDPEHTQMIEAATEYCQKVTGRQFVNATWVETLDEFPTHEMLTAISPLSSVTSIQYIDEAGNPQTWGASLYQEDATSIPGRIKPIVNGSFPSIRGGDYNSVTVTYVAGYGAAGSDVPEIYKRAIRFLVAHWHMNREAWLNGVITAEVQDALRALLSITRVMTF